ncbi:MAG: type II toxin-antitoxin system death-on-curing family toxin [Pseudolysinimonas sp.]
MTEYLEPENAVAAARHLGFHIRDEGLLFSALARPSASAFGADAYPELERKAAALLHSLARNHPLFDGNKRFAWYLTLAFFRLNGYGVVMSNDDAFELVLGVARGDLELDEVTARFRAHLVAR